MICHDVDTDIKKYKIKKIINNKINSSHSRGYLHLTFAAA